MDDEDDRSSDGSDSAGSLVDFLVNDDDEDDEDVATEDEGTEAKALVEDFPYDKRLLEEDESTTGPRRSKRQRRSVQRYQDPEYLKLMLEDVDDDDFEDEDLPQNEDDSDGDFKDEGELADSESDESEDDEEE